MGGPRGETIPQIRTTFLLHAEHEYPVFFFLYYLRILGLRILSPRILSLRIWVLGFWFLGFWAFCELFCKEIPNITQLVLMSIMTKSQK